LYAKKFSKPILNLVNFLGEVEFDENMQKYETPYKYDDEFGKLYEEVNIIFKKMQDYIFQRDKTKRELEYMMQYDALTGLLNKSGFLNSFQSIIDKEEKRRWNALFYIKIANLKTINHAYGFKQGDNFIATIADNIKKDFVNAILLGRIEAGSFALLYEEIEDAKEKATQKAYNIANTLVAILETSISINSKQIKPEIAVGIDLFEERNSPQEVLKNTNIALAEGIKKDKKIAFFDIMSEKFIKESSNIYSELIEALKKDELELFYQLQYDNNENVFGAEALIRWHHSKEGLLTPFRFIPIAEHTDLIVEIGRWVFEQACKQSQKWKKNPKTQEWIISVNVSAKQFRKDDFVSFAHTTAEKYGINPKMIKLELLESLLVQDQEGVAKKMLELKKMGFRISIDDFGTGFSSLQYMKIFPFDQLKIDQSFIRDMFENEKNIPIIKSIIYLASLLNVEVVAEGVEEEKHYKALEKFGCRHFQGYYFAYPQCVDKIEKNISLLSHISNRLNI